MVRAERQCDALVEGRKRALFEGQIYDLPEASVKALIAAGAVRTVTLRVSEPVSMQRRRRA